VLDVTGLGGLVAATQLNNECVAPANEIEAVTRSVMDACLGHAFTDRLNIAEVAKLHSIQPGGYTLHRSPISKVLEPFGEFRRLAKLEHESTICDNWHASTKSDRRAPMKLTVGAAVLVRSDSNTTPEIAPAAAADQADLAISGLPEIAAQS
jgi:hypothetical protein